MRVAELPLASAGAARIAEAAIGLVLLALLVAAGVVQLVRWRRSRRAETAGPGVPALARFTDVLLSDPASFGGGDVSARVLRRRDCVAYGYLAVAEQYAGTEHRGWCTLTVTFPGPVPFLVVDAWDAHGRPDVPLAAPHRAPVGNPGFDATYRVGAGELTLIARLLTPGACAALLATPVQRLVLRDGSLLLRTADGTVLDDAMIAWLSDAAERFLASVPSFFDLAERRGDVLERPLAPLPRGFYGPD